MPINITMPALSPTMTEGNLAKWHVKVGDQVNAGDVIAEIETDKATMEVEAVDEGTVARILVDEGAEGIGVNQTIAVLLEEGEDDSALDTAVAETSAAPEPTADAPPAPTPEVAAAPQPAALPAPAAPVAGGGVDGGARTFASPLARRMAQQAGLALAAIRGSGPHGRIVKRDVEAALSGAPVSPLAAAPTAGAIPMPSPVGAQPFEPEFELQALSSMRRTIAQRLTEAKQTIPHFYLTVECEIDALLASRKQLNATGGGSYKISVNDFVIKASGVALRKVPAANASYSEDGIKLYKSADIAVAVAIDGGLITPVIRDAGNKGLETISGEMRDLAERAREGKLQPEEYMGGTFSISNLGMYGIRQFDAVINPPQGAILAIGAGEQRPVVKDGALAVATMMSCTLSCDHRVVDGAIGAQFLAAFKVMIEEPMNMLL